MTRLTYNLLAAVAVGFAGCSTASSPPCVVATPIVAGMSSAELRSAFGQPLRTEHKPDGSEDWYYNFGIQGAETRAVSEAFVSDSERSYTTGRTSTTTTTTTSLPVHLSPAGRVAGVIPAGRVIVSE